MITIDQLLESVDLDFEPRFVTKDEDGCIKFFSDTPRKFRDQWICDYEAKVQSIYPIKISDFANKKWQECIYEVPRKVDYSKWIGKLCRFWDDGPTIKIGTHYGILTGFDDSDRPFERDNVDYWFKHCEPVRPDDDVIYNDAVNELKGAKND